MESFQESNRHEMTKDQSIVHAMIENAKSSSPRENLENAAMAQNNFMLLPLDQSVSETRDRQYLTRIAQRSEEIRKENNKKA